MAYQPIEDYGMIGDMHTVALVGINGSIDWMCIPRFDSPSVFGAILDDQKGGSFRIWSAQDDATNKQFYWPDTNVLVTRVLSEHGAAEILDFMPVIGEDAKESESRRQVIRQVVAMRGTVDMRMACRPAFDYAREDHTAEAVPHGVIFRSKSLGLSLKSTVPLEAAEGEATARFTLKEGESAVFVLSHLTKEIDEATELDTAEAEQAFRDTVAYWRAWLAQCKYRGRWREMVYRSALALKLMTYAPTGAIVAAPTCSLPEGIGGERNWDYRYTWIRDSAFVIYAFLRLGFAKEAERFMHFVVKLCREANPDGSLQIMYGIDGRKQLTEETLDHLDGYMGSKPVRIGNGAYDQLQLDIYGELMDGAYLYNKHGQQISYDTWRNLRALVDWVCDNWRRLDEGVWETRGGTKQFVYSKLMCWVAVDRGLRLADKRSFPCDRTRWLGVRDRIYEDIMTHGWSEERQAFVQAYGSTSLDAANLMMQLTFFVAPTDPRMLKTLAAIMQPPEKGGLLANHLVYRYNVEESPDGLAGEEGTFNICTFWLVEALARAGRFHREMLDEARLMFERMLGFSNHVGLYAEETGPRGEALGNFPQAFTHLALISAAFNLDRELGEPGSRRR
ncbi:MAG TPA: glycoside hydrolase family 15 protein [Geminicoccaceae bacterium]